MTTYESKTGYVKRISTGEIFKTDKIYLGIYDSIDDYKDTTKTKYDAYVEEMESKMPQYK